jgi:predicted metalloprotease with PDZ domain
VLSAVAGTNMSGFYDRYIRGVETLPYDEALAAAGLRLLRTPRGTSSSGIALDANERQSVRLGSLRAGSAAQEAGLQEGDVLLAIGGTRATRDNWNTLLGRYRAGDRVPVEVERFRSTLELMLELREPEQFNYRLEEIPTASAAAIRLRNSWLTGS